MPSAAERLPHPMTAAEFLNWAGDGSGRIYELVEVGAYLLRRGENGEWPANSTDLKVGDSVELSTIEFSIPLVEAYHGTDVAPL